jgi:hypothetical protein
LVRVGFELVRILRWVRLIGGGSTFAGREDCDSTCASLRHLLFLPFCAFFVRLQTWRRGAAPSAGCAKSYCVRRRLHCLLRRAATTWLPLRFFAAFKLRLPSSRICIHFALNMP